MRGFNWAAIESYGDSEVALYRLLGEMLQYKATLDDLDKIAAFLRDNNLGSETWHSIGEALHRTTSGSPTGYDLWAEWTRSLPDYEYNETRQGEAWYVFGLDVSEASYEDPHKDVIPPPRVSASRGDDDYDEDDDDTDVATNVLAQEAGVGIPRPITGVIGESATSLLSLVPSGVYNIELFGKHYQRVDNYTLLALFKHGVLFGARVEYQGEMVPVHKHPSFGVLVSKVKAETRRLLRRQGFSTGFNEFAKK